MNHQDLSESQKRILRQTNKLKHMKKKSPNVFQQIQNQIKTPIWLIIAYLNKEQPFLIDAAQSFQQFKQSIKAKLAYEGQLSTNGYFFYVLSVNSQTGKLVKTLVTNVSNLQFQKIDVQMGKLFSQHKSSNGWIEIQLQQDSIFG